MAVLFVLIMIVLVAFLVDHYSRLVSMGWAPAPDAMFKGRSIVDPIGAALGELGRVEAPFGWIASVFGIVGKASELLYKPIGAAFDVIGKASELAFKPIGAVLSLIAGARSK